MSSSQAHRFAAGSIRELLQVALPLVVSTGSLSLMLVVDRVFLTWYSREALAAAMPAGMMHWVVISAAMGVTGYVNTFVAQYEGANRRDRVAASIWQGVFVALIAGCLLLLFIPLSTPIFDLIGHEEKIQPLEAAYFSVLCLGSVPMLLTSALACFYTGRGQTTVVMWVTLMVAVLNIFFDYLLIFGVGVFPEWGIRGAAAATVSANTVAATLYAVLLLRPAVSRSYAVWQNRRLDRELFGRLIRYGLPNGFQSLADFAGFTFFVLLIGRLGTAQLAATNLAFNLNTLAFVPMIGVGTAVSTLVGRRIGEGRPQLAVRTTWSAFTMSSAYMLMFAAIYLLFPEVIIAPYLAGASATDSAVIRGDVIYLLRFVAVYSFFDAMVIVFGNAIRGAGDTRFSLWFSLFTGWTVMVLPTWVALVWYGGGLTVSWCACTAHLIVLGVGYLIRFQQGRWTSMRVIEDETK